MNKKTAVVGETSVKSKEGSGAQCPRCGLMHPDSYNKCVSCGAALAGAGPTATAAAPKKSFFKNPLAKTKGKSDTIDQLEKAFRNDGLGDQVDGTPQQQAEIAAQDLASGRGNGQFDGIESITDSSRQVSHIQPQANQQQEIQNVQTQVQQGQFHPIQNVQILSEQQPAADRDVVDTKVSDIELRANNRVLQAARKEQEAADRELLAQKRIQEAERRLQEALAKEQEALQREHAAVELEEVADQRIQELEQFMQQAGRAEREAEMREQKASRRLREAQIQEQEAERRQSEAQERQQQAERMDRDAELKAQYAARKQQEAAQRAQAAASQIDETELQEQEAVQRAEEAIRREEEAARREQEVLMHAKQEGFRRAELAFIEMETKRRAAEQAKADEEARAAAAQAMAEEQTRAMAAQARAEEQARAAAAAAKAKADEQAQAAASAAEARADEQARAAASASQARADEQARAAASAAAKARADEQARAAASAAQARAEEQARSAAAAAKARADEQARVAAPAWSETESDEDTLLAESNSLISRTDSSGIAHPESEPYDINQEDEFIDETAEQPVKQRTDIRRVVWNRFKNISIPHSGKFFFAAIVMISAGATFFFITKAADDQDLVEQGLTQLSKGQYAFSVQSLTKAAAKRPHDARVFLALARAYIGVDQVDEAWKCISHAQQLGAGVATDPALAMELAGYYQKRDNSEKAAELLRPLAKANVPGTRADLADLDAAWGDDLVRDGKLEEALRCWEEVNELKAGARASEAPARLTTIYQKLATTLANDNNTNNDGDALKYLNKLNSISEDPKSLEMAADLQQKSGQTDDAIGSLRKAASLDSNDREISAKLAKLLNRRGQELLDQGNEQGNQYIEEASGLATNASSPLSIQTTKQKENGGNTSGSEPVRTKTTESKSATSDTAGSGYRIMTPPEPSSAVKSSARSGASVETKNPAETSSAEKQSSSDKPLEMRLIDEDPSLSAPQEQH